MTLTTIISLCIAVISGITGTMLGVMNYINSRRSRIDPIRNKIYEEQLTFFKQLNVLMSSMENVIIDLNQSYADNDKTLDQLDDEIDRIDVLVSGNDILIPDELSPKLDNYIMFLNEYYMRISKDEDFWDNKKRKILMDEGLDLLNEIREYLGLESLIRRNRKFLDK